MQIRELINLIRSGYFKGISSDSRSAREGFLFIAVKGEREDGGRFISEAIFRGAKGIVCDVNAKMGKIKGVHLVRAKDTRVAPAQLAAEFYCNPSSKIKVVGVTGTNGKTTVTYL